MGHTVSVATTYHHAYKVKVALVTMQTMGVAMFQKAFFTKSGDGLDLAPSHSLPILDLYHQSIKKASCQIIQKF